MGSLGQTSGTAGDNPPRPEAKPVADYIHQDAAGREYIIITRMIERDGCCGYEQFRRYLEPLDESDSHRVFLPFAKV